MTVGVQSVPIRSPAMPGVIVPLTERVLAKVGPPRALWIAVWGCLATVTYEITFRVYHLPFYPGLAFSLGAAYANLFSLWAVPYLAQRVNALQPRVEELVGATAADAKTHPFRLLGSTVGPLLLLPVTAVGGTLHLLGHPSLVTIIAAALLTLGWLPSACATWTILMIFLGLDRLGRQPLHLRPFHQDRSLGLAPLGQLALSAFTLLIAALVPVTIATATDRQSVLTALAHLTAGVAALFLSLYRLHEQLAAARVRYLVQVRRLTAEAFAPVEDGWSLDTLASQAGRINAARALEQHVATIQRWPVGETAIARIVAIATSVVTAMIVRIVTSKL